jgi:general secretion pathway protein I
VRARKQTGFTLLEVVIAFVVLALTLSVVFEIFSTWLARTSDLSDRSQALAIARSRLAGVGIEEGLKEGEARGESGDRRYAWAVRVERYSDQSDAGPTPRSTYSLYRAEARVKWRGVDGREREIALSNLHLGPRI